MAKNNWTPDTDEKPADAPKNRDQLVEEHRMREVREPASAPRETDAEAGGNSDLTEEGPIPRKDPAKTYTVNTQSKASDVKAGPGDAGGARSPRTTPEPVRQPRASGTRMLVIGGAVLIVVLLLALLIRP